MSADLSGFADGWFDEGAVTFETGANAGRTIEVKSWAQAIRRLELWAPTGLPVEVGDQLRIYPGCHKRVLEDCRDRFRIPGSLLFDKGNARNFRGEPYVPGSPSRPCRRVAADALGAHSSIGRLGLIAAGGYAFGPIGAAAGALLGGFLFGSSGPKIEGRALATSMSARAPMAA